MVRCGSGSTKISKLRILVLARQSLQAGRAPSFGATPDQTNARKTAVSFVVFSRYCRGVDMVVGAWYGRALALAGALSALVPALAMWGFTVDDALIPLRYAHHLASGAGYRFDAVGPSTDGVTPLPWAPLLAPIAAGGDLVAALERAKALGVVAWAFAGAVLGLGLAKRASGGRRETLHAAVALLVLGLAFPIGAWAASGMETGLATALATCAAVSFERPRRAALLAGLAATLRPELVVWAVIVAGGAAAAGSLARGHAARTVALALAPFAICAVVRLVAFGRPAPLALLAKPSDAQHGVVYAGAAAVVVLTPILACAPLALARASSLARTLALAALAHVAVIVAVGGDWMPYARLMVPVAPSLALAFVDVGRVARTWSTLARVLLALAVGVLIGVRAAPAGRHVHEARKDLIAQARPLLAGAKVVAALDVGWVGASTGASVVDLAGLTDPSIAALHGGHTSKAVDLAMLLDRDVDTIVVYGEPRLVEQRLLRSALFAERFERQATIAFGAPRAGSAQRYEIYRRR
ncbi:MAG: hypothetical protein KF764_15365 [Labilithrix sp.]|nr:hypothetical protein [Labilithrix sp.]